jgi:dihydroorotate dehydrogenase electron transfer subunit
MTHPIGRHSTQLRQQFVAQVTGNEALCREHWRLLLALPQFPPTEPGQFVQLACRDIDQPGAEEDREIGWPLESPPRPFPTGAAHAAELLAPVAFLRRPFSLAGRVGRSDGSVELEIIHRVVGVGTGWLARRRPGDAVGVLGPLGNRFTFPAKDQIALLVGGGVGIPPMLYLAEALGRARISAIAFCGAVTRELLPLTIDESTPPPATRLSSSKSEASGAVQMTNVREFARHGIPSVISTDDGSLGFRGFVTQALEQWLDQFAPGPWPSSSPSLRVEDLAARLLIYTCGPEPMMKRVADIAIAHRIECQVAVERAMACGMGTCQSCCIRVRKPDPRKPPLPGKDWCWRLACTDGPIFRAAELLW